LETLRRNIRELDYTLIGVLLLLAVFGSVAVAVATHGKLDSSIPSHVVMKQLLWEVVGFVAMFAVAAADYRSLRKIHWWLYGGTLLLLVAVFAFPPISGARAWIPLKFMSLQPSELAKMALIVSTAVHMATVDESELPNYGFRKSWQIWALCIVPFALTWKEPALGQALVMIAITGCSFMLFTKRSYFAMVVGVILAVTVFIGIVATQYPTQSKNVIDGLVNHHVLKDYQASRIVTWLDPGFDTNNTGYNIHQAQIAVGSGQVFGEGLFNGISTNGGWVPNQHTDYIFTAIGEEFGFIGSSVLIMLFLLLIYRLIKSAATAQDTFGTYIIMGITGMFAFQVFENVGMDVYLSPSTGITLPFVSYGGTSLVVNYMAIGLVLSISMRRKKLRFS
jgi:rod shape determining protein RodA